jgi:hypothetical protein
MISSAGYAEFYYFFQRRPWVRPYIGVAYVPVFGFVVMDGPSLPVLHPDVHNTICRRTHDLR